ncbi:mycothiol system anti-sigma-R factor [Nostocoides sp. F2B08]|uniref:mycothiol system anti-sigma-R factor n=1 Tax=Nostocoides sp. F2B08 TaxID=2653936 RepID=UPI001263C42F|nr:mycothiol system anti-sigma-R factor [Tetrasphaera sp. F2B08]KAB7746185.1 mycothiol system anti-sigma-R factor [Tetrasphaera sp. F2B08]
MNDDRLVPSGEGTQAGAGDDSVTPHYHDTDCSEFLLRIYEYMDGEMGPEENLRFEAHVRECRPCLEQHRVDQTVKSLIRRVEPVAHAPEALRASIIARITTIRAEPQG